jgi:hypothetical protein
MPKPFGQLMELIAQKANIDTAELTELFQIKADVSDDVFTKVETKLSTLIDLNDAKHNNELHKHFKALSLNRVDQLINEAIEQGLVDDEYGAELKANPNTYDRAKKLISKLSEPKIQAIAKDSEPLKAEIKKLNDEVLKTKEHYESKIQELSSQSENKFMQYQIDSLLNGKEYANKDLPKNVQVLTAKTLLEQELNAKKAKIVMTANGLKLVNAEAPELDFTDSNKTVQFDDFVNRVLAGNKLLQVSAPVQTVKQTQTIINTPTEDNPAFARNQERLQRLTSEVG